MSLLSYTDEPHQTFHDACALARKICIKIAAEGQELPLASGKKTNYYINARTLMHHPQGVRLAGYLLWRRIRHLHGDFIGGMETGAIPVCTAIMHNVSGEQKDTLRGFYVRKEAKKHGNTSRIEALEEGVTLHGRKVIIVEDTTTTGGSLLAAVDAVLEEGAIVEDVVTFFDREEGGRQACRRRGLAFHSIIPVRTCAGFLFPEGFEPRIWD